MAGLVVVLAALPTGILGEPAPGHGPPTALEGPFLALASVPNAPHVAPARVGSVAGVLAGDPTLSGLLVTPVNGTVGTLVTANGAGIARNSSVGFAMGGDGATIPSTCRADDRGRFPGTSGTPCTFLVPQVPGGNETVVAAPTGWGTEGPGVRTGSGPWDLAIDWGTKMVAVPNFYGNSVGEVSARNHSLVRSIPVGSEPIAVAYDAGLGELFVVNYGSENVSVISESTGRTVATVRVGWDPDAIAYDPGTGEMYVANYFNGTLSVISDTTDTVSRTIGVGYNPSAVAYDPAQREIWVANLGSGNVSIVADANHTVLSSVPTGRWPYGLAYDPRSSEMFVANELACNLTVIADGNRTVVASVPLGGATFPIGVAYDAASDQVFVADYGVTNVSVVAGATDTVVQTIPVGRAPIAVTYDNASGDLYVSNFDSNNVSVIPTSNVSVRAAFTVDARLMLRTASGSADFGENVTVAGDGFGNASAFTRFELDSTDLRCVSAAAGACVGGVPVPGADGAISVRVDLPTSGVSGTHLLRAVDGAGNSATASATIYSAPSAATPIASPSRIDLGQSVNLSVGAVNGTGSYTFRWSGSPPGCPSTDEASFSCVPTATGNFSIAVNLTDSNGARASAGTVGLPVFPDPVSGAPSASRSSGGVDAGQSVAFGASPDLGDGTYASASWFGLPPGCRGETLQVTCAGAELPAGTYSISVAVTDSNGVTSPAGPSLSFTVDPDPVVGAPTPTPGSVDVGLPAGFSTTVTGGSGGLGFSWSGLPPGCIPQGPTVPTCSPTSSGSYLVQVTVTDSNGYTTRSVATPFSVFPDPVARVVVDHAILDLGQTVVLSANVTGGSGGSTFVWSGLPVGCAGQGPVVGCTPSATGRFLVAVRVTDSDLGWNSSPTYAVTVHAALQAGAGAETAHPYVGGAVRFDATSEGGTGPVVFAWAFGDGSAGSGPTTAHTYATVGTYVVTLRANDSAGASVEQQLSVTVAAAALPTAGASLPIPPWSWVVLAAGAVAAAGAGALLGHRRRRLTIGGTRPRPSSPADR